ncbi:MAG: TolC family protein [Candidatus Binatia bacterium]|nr:TolC family protein [Candidatus Binatia bacterium]
MPKAGLAVKVEEAHREIPPPDFGIVYDLPALIDLAQRRNPATRIAWEVARAAAAGVGLAEAQYYPSLALLASYGGGYWDLDVETRADLSALGRRDDALGALLAGAGEKTLNLDVAAGFTRGSASANLRWLLFDFGAREAVVEVAEKNLSVANLTFDATHQLVAFAVVEAFSFWQATADHERATEVSLEAARVVEEAAEARYRLGKLTEPDLLQARSEAVAADYARERARAESEVAYVKLAQVTGLPPGTELLIARLDVSHLPASLEVPLQEFIDRALAQRPDLLARAAALEAREASLRRSRAAALPRIGMLGVAGWSQMNNSIRKVPALDDLDFNLQRYAAFLTFEWAIFDGFARMNTQRMAGAALAAAEAKLEEARDKAIAEVWRDYVKARNAIARRKSVESLVAAANTRFASALEGFNQGLVDMPTLVLARAARAQAERARAESDAALLSSLAHLALGAGEMSESFLEAGRKLERSPGALYSDW